MIVIVYFLAMLLKFGSEFNFSKEELNAVLPEGLPSGMLKEFEDTKRCALLIRQSFLDLRDNFRRIVDPPTWSSSGKCDLF